MKVNLALKRLISVKIDSDENGFDSIHFGENLNLKIKEIYSNINCINEKHWFRKAFVRLKLISEGVYLKAFVGKVKAQ